MATLVCFHAHPDDECILTGGVMAKAASEGHRVVLVVATKGELGEVPEGYLAAGEELWARRVIETQAAADVLGASRVEFLGYRDSGMMGLPTNDAPGSFWTADVEEAADRLAAILTEENAEVLVIYDENGNYGHPDHIQVHRVGKRAAEKAGTPRVYQATMNRDRAIAGLRENAERMRGLGIEMPELPDDVEFAMPEAVLTAAVDVSAFLDHKRQAMQAHGSQISEESFFLKMPSDIFGATFGTEWFIREGEGPGITETDLFPSGS